MNIITITDPIDNLCNGALGEFNFWTILLRLVLSLVFSAVIGIERSNKRHSAGLRTFILVCMSSTIAALFDVYFTVNYNESFPVASVAVVIGSAIISANTLLYSSKGQIKGLTTAAGLWSTSLIGITFGAGLYTLGILSFALVMLALNVLPNLEVYLKNRSNHFEVHLELKNKGDLQQFIATIRKLGLIIDDIESNPAYLNSGLSVYTISLTIHSKELKDYKTHKEIIEALNTLDYINCIEEIN